SAPLGAVRGLPHEAVGISAAAADVADGKLAGVQSDSRWQHQQRLLPTTLIECLDYCPHLQRRAARPRPPLPVESRPRAHHAIASSETREHAAKTLHRSAQEV